MKKRIVIFASGRGSNAREIIRYFRNHETVEVVGVYANKKEAGVLSVASDLGVRANYISKDDLIEPEKLLAELNAIKPDLIVLAGFLLKVPEHIVHAFPNKIINIHPALLPKYGGKGMYGKYVHEAVAEANDTETGITIHYVNEHYDEGAVIFQKTVALPPGATADVIASKVQTLEHTHFPKVIERLLSDNHG